MTPSRRNTARRQRYKKHKLWQEMGFERPPKKFTVFCARCGDDLIRYSATRRAVCHRCRLMIMRERYYQRYRPKLLRPWPRGVSKRIEWLKRKWAKQKNKYAKTVTTNQTDPAGQ